jgi:hypothetical protein
VREAHWYHAGGTRARLRGARGVRGPEMPPLGPPRGSRAWPPGAAPGARRQAPGARRHGRRSPRPGGASSRHGGVYPGLKGQWVAPDLKLIAGGRERPRACRMPSFNARGRPGAGEGPNHTAQRRRRGGLARLVPRCDRAASGAKPTGALLIAPARGNAARGVRMSNTPFGSGGGRWGGVLAHMFAICSHRGAHAWRSDTLAPRAALRRDQGECGTWGGRLRPAARRARG